MIVSARAESSGYWNFRRLGAMVRSSSFGGPSSEMNDEVPLPLDFVCGDATGIEMPAHPDALRAAGADFLPLAFHSFGSLRLPNRVARIIRFEHCPGGSTGQKLFLSIAY